MSETFSIRIKILPFDSNLCGLGWYLSCDQMVHRYKEYTWNQLRPLEQIEIVECLELRAIAEKIRNNTDLPIPVDILYNWQRKWIMGAEIIQAGIII